MASKEERIKRIPVSLKEAEMLHQIKQQAPDVKKKVIYSFYPCDAHDCPCQVQIQNLNNKLKTMGPREQIDYKFKTEYLRCPRDKTGMTKFRIYCGNCGDLCGELYATDISLKDYCDFHYISEHDGEFWYGTLGINISPIDGTIGIECCCGVNTTDFRANRSLPEALREKKILETSYGREFGKKDSQFKVLPVDL